MNPMISAMRELANMDELAQGDSLIHRLHPLSKLLITILYIVVVLSFPNRSVSFLLPMVLYPVFLSALSGIPLRLAFYKLRYLIPLIAFVGIWNPIINRTPALTIGALTISEGMLSFLVLLMKGIFALMASFLFVATTGIEKICYAFRLLHVPKLLVTTLLITYRYISLLLSEAAALTNAYHLRAPGQKGIHYKVWGSFLGQLLLRSMDRATALYQSMQMRGFTGSFYYARPQKAGLRDLVYILVCAGIFLLFRLVPVTVLIGRLFV